MKSWTACLSAGYVVQLGSEVGNLEKETKIPRATNLLYGMIHLSCLVNRESLILYIRVKRAGIGVEMVECDLPKL